MSLSKRFKEMRDRLRELRMHMLPEKFSLTGDYTERQLDRARGYRLLVHAEIESYLEDVVKQASINGISKWKNNNKPSVMLISFLASFHSNWDAVEEFGTEQINRSPKPRNIGEKVNEIINLAQIQYINIIKHNHGVREKNLKSLICPIGIEMDDLDQTWISNLDSFGSLRGEVAHNTKKTTAQINPSDEHERVKALLIGLRDLDSKIFLLSNN